MITNKERINFPDNPEKNKIYSIGDVFWKFDGNGWVRQLVNYTPNPRMNDAVSIFQTEHDFLIHYMDVSAGIKRGDVAVVLETKSTYKNINGTHSADSEEIADHWVKFIVQCSDSEGAGKVNVINAGDDGEYPTDSPEYDWPRDGWRRGIIVVSEDWNASFMCIKDNFDKFELTDKDFNNKWVELEARKDNTTLVPDITTLLGLHEHDVLHDDGSITNIFTDPCGPYYIGEKGCKKDRIQQGHTVVVEDEGKTYKSISGGNGDIQEWQEILASGSSEVFYAISGKVEYPKPYGWHKGSIVIDKDDHISYIKIGSKGRLKDFDADANNWAELSANTNTNTYPTLADLYADVDVHKGDVAVVEDEKATYKCVRISASGVATTSADWIEISKMDRIFPAASEAAMLALSGIRQGDLVVINNDLIYKNTTGDNNTVLADWQEIHSTSDVVEYSCSTIVDYSALNVHTFMAGYNKAIPSLQTIHEDVQAKDWTGHQHAKGDGAVKGIFIDKNHIAFFSNDNKRMFKWIGNKPVLLGGPGATYTDPVTPSITYTAVALEEADFLLIGNIANDDTTVEFDTEQDFIDYYNSPVYPLKRGDVAVVKETGKSYKNSDGRPAIDHNDISNHWTELISSPSVIQTTTKIPEFGDVLLRFDHNKIYDEIEQIGDELNPTIFKIDPIEMKLGTEIILSYITYRRYPLPPNSLWMPQPGLPDLIWDNTNPNLQFKNVPKMEYDTKYYLRLTCLSSSSSSVKVKEVLIDVVGFESPPIP